MWAKREKKYTTLTLVYVRCLWGNIQSSFSWNSFSFHPKKKHFYYFASSLKLTLLPSFSCLFVIISIFPFLPHIALFYAFAALWPSTISHKPFSKRSLKSTSQKFSEIVYFLPPLSLLIYIFCCIYVKERRNIFMPAKLFWFRFLLFTALRVPSFLIVYFAWYKFLPYQRIECVCT